MSSDNVSDLLVRGNASFKDGDIKDAATWFQNAANLDPGSFAAHANLGNALIRLDLYEEAIKAYSIALDIKPLAPLVARNLGECFEKTNRLDKAVQYYSMAVQITPENAEILIDLGNSYQKQGDTEKAIENYQKALDMNPTLSNAQHNIGLCLYDDGCLVIAEKAFQSAVKIDPENVLGTCFLGVILEHQGKCKQAKEFLDFANKKSRFSRCLIDSARYAFKKGRDARYFANTADVLRYAITESNHDGLFMEFGVYYGTSLCVIANSTNNIVHGFDSFKGLPESWFVGEEKGSLATEPTGAYTTKGMLPNVPGNTRLHVGWFEDTLPPFLNDCADYVGFINIDCDIYSSTKTILVYLKDRIREGTIIVFDEYFCYPEWRSHEYKAFHEFLDEASYTYEYIAFSYFTGQAAVRIQRVSS